MPGPHLRVGREPPTVVFGGAEGDDVARINLFVELLARHAVQTYLPDRADDPAPAIFLVYDLATVPTFGRIERVAFATLDPTPHHIGGADHLGPGAPTSHPVSLAELIRWTGGDRLA